MPRLVVHPNRMLEVIQLQNTDAPATGAAHRISALSENSLPISPAAKSLCKWALSNGVAVMASSCVLALPL